MVVWPEKTINPRHHRPVHGDDMIDRVIDLEYFCTRKVIK